MRPPRRRCSACLALKTPRHDGTTHLPISPLEFIPPGIELPPYGRQIRSSYVRWGSAVPIRRREQRTVDGSSVSTSIERPLSGFRLRERTTACVCSTL
jgi:hypothetical protein